MCLSGIRKYPASEMPITCQITRSGVSPPFPSSLLQANHHRNQTLRSGSGYESRTAPSVQPYSLTTGPCTREGRHKTDTDTHSRVCVCMCVCVCQGYVSIQRQRRRLHARSLGGVSVLRFQVHSHEPITHTTKPEGSDIGTNQRPHPVCSPIL